MMKETEQNTNRIKDIVCSICKVYGQQCSYRAFKPFWDPLYSKLVNFSVTSEKFLHRMIGYTNQPGFQNPDNDSNDPSFVSLLNCLRVANAVISSNPTFIQEYAPSFSSS